MPMMTSDTAPRLALERAAAVIEKCHPELAGRLSRGLDLVLDDFRRHRDQDRAWNSGKLNASQAPLEFTFSTLSSEVRYAVEVGGPDVAPTGRLDVCARLMGQAGVGSSGDEVVGVLSGLQKEHPDGLRWGAWLGVRHLPEGDEFKVYAELPRDTPPIAAEFVREALGTVPVLAAGRRLQPVAVGRVPGSPRTEVYFELEGVGLDADAIDRLLGPLGLGADAPLLFDLMRFAQEALTPAGPSLPEVDYGFSVSALPGGAAPVCSVFAQAGGFLGPDAFVRWSMLRLASLRAWRLGAYPALTEPLADRFTTCDSHNVVGFLLAGGARSGMHISLSPPLAMPR